MSDHFSVRMTLLDAQVVDRDRLPVGRIDDLEVLIPPHAQVPEIAAMLTGSQALGERLGGALGRWMASASVRLRDERRDAPTAIDASLIAEIGPLIELRVAAEGLPHVAALEHWLAKRFVERLPGTGDARK